MNPADSDVVLAQDERKNPTIECIKLNSCSMTIDGKLKHFDLWIKGWYTCYPHVVITTYGGIIFHNVITQADIYYPSANDEMTKTMFCHEDNTFCFQQGSNIFVCDFSGTPLEGYTIRPYIPWLITCIILTNKYVITCYPNTTKNIDIHMREKEKIRPFISYYEKKVQSIEQCGSWESESESVNLSHFAKHRYLRINDKIIHSLKPDLQVINGNGSFYELCVETDELTYINKLKVRETIKLPDKPLVERCPTLSHCMTI